MYIASVTYVFHDRFSLGSTAAIWEGSFLYILKPSSSERMQSIRNGMKGSIHTDRACSVCSKHAQQHESRVKTLQKRVEMFERIISDSYCQWATNRRSVGVQTDKRPVVPSESKCQQGDLPLGMPARGYKYKVLCLQSEVDDLKRQLAAYRTKKPEQFEAQEESRRPSVNRDITEYIYKASNRAAKYEGSIQRLHELVGQHKQDSLRKTEEIGILRAEREELFYLRAQHQRCMEYKIVQSMLDNAQWLVGNLDLGQQAIRLANGRAVAAEAVNEIQNRLICDLKRQIGQLNGTGPAHLGMRIVPVSVLYRLQAQVRHLQLLLADRGVIVDDMQSGASHEPFIGQFDQQLGIQEGVSFDQLTSFER